MDEGHVLDHILLVLTGALVATLVWLLVVKLVFEWTRDRSEELGAMKALRESVAMLAVLEFEGVDVGLTQEQINLIFLPGHRAERVARRAQFDERARHEIDVDLDDLPDPPPTDDPEAA